MQNQQFPNCHIYLSTMLVYMGFMVNQGLIARIKKPMSDEFLLSESFLGVLDALTFLGAMAGFLYLGSVKFKRPVLSLFLICISIIITMELFILPKLLFQFRHIILLISRLMYGLLRPFHMMSYLIMKHYFMGDKSYKTQVWFSVGKFGVIVGVLLPQYLLTSFKMDWGLAQSISLLFLLFSSIYMWLAVKQIQQQEEQTQQNVSLVSFAFWFWSNPLNILHSLLVVISQVFTLMLFWLPYFFLKIGYDQGSLISVSYSLGYILSSLLYQPLKYFFSQSIGIAFLVVLLLNNMLSLFLIQLSDDPSEILQYILFLFFSSMISSGYLVYYQTTDQSNLLNQNLRKLTSLVAMDKFFLQLGFAIEMAITGVLMDHNLHSLFYVNGVMILLTTILHIVRICAYPRSFDPVQRDIPEALVQEQD